MEHTKKYVIMDPRFVKPTMREKALSGLDSDIHNILESDEPDDIKVKQYISTLNRYRNYSEPPPPSTPALEKLEPQVLQSVPKNVKYKAKQLLKKLKSQRDVEWTDDGELIWKQTKIPKSDITELVSDVLDKKATKRKPVGWEALAAGLKTANTPRELINNPSRWSFMQGTLKRKKTKEARQHWIPYSS